LVEAEMNEDMPKELARCLAEGTLNPMPRGNCPRCGQNVVPTLRLLCIWDDFLLGARVALAHVASGLCVALLLLDVLFVSYRKLPFTSAYVRSDDLKSIGLLYVAGMLIVAAVLARLERVALASTSGEVAFFGSLAALIVSTHVVDTVRRRTRVPIDLDEGPANAIQPLELIR
jgi:hypothetical protein